MPKSRTLVGLTGGIGSGKSTVATMLAEYGAGLVDADRIARAATMAGGAAMEAIEKTFGARFITSDGALNRDLMRDLVFSDGAARAKLDGIVHPVVAQSIQMAVANAPQSVVVLDIPLLAESPHWRSRLDCVLVVDCQPATQHQRVRQRNGWSEDVIAGVLSAQAARSERLAVADMVIYNDEIGLQSLQTEVDALARRLGL